jgi:hypothetical protein
VQLVKKPHMLTSTQLLGSTEILQDIRKAEAEWNFAQSQFQDALGADHVDYAIFCLEAAEKKLDMLLRKAKWQWNEVESPAKSRGKG